MRLNPVIAAGLAGLALGLLGCDAPENAAAPTAEASSAPAQTRAPIVIPVEAEYPMRGSISDYLKTVSTVQAERRVEVMPKTPGQCVSLGVEEGDRVQQGRVLAELEKDEAMAQLRQNEVQLRQNQAEFERMRQMYDSGLVSKAELDNAKFAYESSQATVAAQRLQVQNLTLRAPIDGIVISKNVNVGDLVSSGTPAFVIVDPQSYMVTIDLDEKHLPNLDVGQDADVSIRSLPGEVLRATVRRINPNVDPTTGTVKVLLDFVGDVKSRLRESAHAEVRLVMETREDAVLVPKSAVLDKDGRKYVFTVAEAPDSAGDDPELGGAARHLTAERREVETGFEDAEYWEIRRGLDEDTPIITLGQQALEPGTPIRVTNVEDALAENADLSFEEALALADQKRQEGARTVRRGGPRLR